MAQFTNDLISLTLGKDFYEKYSDQLSPELFGKEYFKIYEAIQQGHSKYATDLTTKEVAYIINDMYPSLSQAAQDNIEDTLKQIDKVEPINPELGIQLLQNTIKRDIANKMLGSLLMYVNGDADNYDRALELAREEAYTDVATLQSTTTDISELLEQVKDNTKWRINISSVASIISGIGPGNFGIVFARPEVGKTGCWVSLCAGPEGFLEQGAVVLAIVNEESSGRTVLRAVNSYTGHTTDDITQNISAAQDKWAEVKDRFIVIDAVGITVAELKSLIEKHKPDILVVDQLDKVRIDGSYSRTDEKLRALYTEAREIAKLYDLAFLALSQASAEAEGRLNLTLDQMENSRTGKAAESDLVIGIGKRNSFDDDGNDVRSICVLKNKISGNHGSVHVRLDKYLSRISV